MRSIIEGIQSYTKKALLQYLNCQTQVKERPPSELKLFSSLTNKLVNHFNNMAMIQEDALKFITCIEKNFTESFFQVSASPDQNNSETFSKVSAPPFLDSSGISHQVSTPPNSSSSGISQQESALFFSDDTGTYTQVSESPDQMVKRFPIRCQNQIQLRNQQVREGNLINPSTKYLGMIFLAFTKCTPGTRPIWKSWLRFPFKRFLGLPSQVWNSS